MAAVIVGSSSWLATGARLRASDFAAVGVEWEPGKAVGGGICGSEGRVQVAEADPISIVFSGPRPTQVR